ncbi:uncharacterized protein [Montipora capricornis]|uniref:uncharacterized protein n=1 Tax=Montipora capricornis TaxID=246305 RepID=UPI0035F0FBEE
MKFFSIFLIVVCLTCPAFLPFAEGEIDHHILEIIEKGTAFTGGDEIDDKQKVEIFRVPGHTENVPAEDVFYDFKMGVTVIKILSKKACYIYTKMDPSLPSQHKLKADIKQATSQQGSLPVTTEQNLLKITGPAHRPSLTKAMLAFCGVLPIYKVDVYRLNTSANSGEETILRKPRLHSRQIRQAGVSFDASNFTVCNNHNSLDNVKGCIKADIWDLRCEWLQQPKSESFYYYPYVYVYVRCRYSLSTQTWKCDQGPIDAPLCCNLVCPYQSPTD